MFDGIEKEIAEVVRKMDPSKDYHISCEREGHLLHVRIAEKPGGNLPADEAAWGPDKDHAPDCAYRNKGECTCPKSEPKKQFAVYVVDNRHVKYIVDADSQEEAQHDVEASEDADKEFGHKALDSQWYVDQVEEC